MLERIIKYTLTVVVLALSVLLWRPVDAAAEQKAKLQSAGVRWGSSYAWPRFRANQRSFRFKGAGHGKFSGARSSSFKILTSRSANFGSSIKSNLPSSQRTVKRTYGRTGRISSRQRIVSWRRYNGARRVQRGATIGKRK